ncbi:MAG: hypothetical protein WC004_01475 [Candidatus Absconditabacterales bacterium]
MKVRTYALIILIAIIGGFARLSYGTGPSVDITQSWDAFLRQPMFRSPVRASRWYKGTLAGEVSASSTMTGTVSLQGALGFGSDPQQSLLHYKGTMGAYDINIDRLQEQHETFVRSQSTLLSGAAPQVFLHQLLGIISNTDDAFVHLRGFDSYNWLQYLLNPRSVFTALSGALSLPVAGCKSYNKCDILLDPDFLVSLPQTDPLMSFFQDIVQQQIRYDPIKQYITIDILQSRTASISGKIQGNKMELMRDRRGVVRELITVQHEVKNNHHVIMLTIEHDGEPKHARNIAYDVYPDGRDMSVHSLLTGKLFTLKGNWYDAGAFSAISKGTPLDIYGLLNAKNY